MVYAFGFWKLNVFTHGFAHSHKGHIQNTYTLLSYIFDQVCFRENCVGFVFEAFLSRRCIRFVCAEHAHRHREMCKSFGTSCVQNGWIETKSNYLNFIEASNVLLQGFAEGEKN